MNLLGNRLLASDPDFGESVQKMGSRVEYKVRKAVIPAAGLGTWLKRSEERGNARLGF